MCDLKKNYIQSKLWYECVICHQKYSHRTNLRRHIRGAHQHRRFHCHHCNGEFARKDALKKHLKKVQPVPETTTSSEGPTECVSIACQTKKAGLHRSVTKSHQGTNTERTKTRDQKVGTPRPSFKDMATSPIQWGNLDNHSRQPTPPVEAYTTVNGDFWQHHVENGLTVISSRDENPLPEDLRDFPANEAEFFKEVSSLELDFMDLV